VDSAPASKEEEALFIVKTKNGIIIEEDVVACRA
jgi:hypothetical protein